MRIVIHGEPISQKRARFSPKAYGHRFRTGKGNFLVDTQAKEKEVVKWQMIDALRREYADIGIAENTVNLPQNDEFYVHVTFHTSPNLSDSLAIRNAKLWGLESFSSKPDVDNLIKFYLDCGNGILWSDDAKIIELHAVKKYSNNPRTVIVVEGKKKKKHPELFDLISPYEFNELTLEASKLRTYHSSDPEIYLKEKDNWHANVSDTLIKFSKKYAKLLLKISKLEETINDATNANERPLKTVSGPDETSQGSV